MAAKRRLRAGAVVAAVLVVGSVAVAAPEPPESHVTISAAAPRWGSVAPGSWTPYAVAVRNDGEVDFDGEVVLVAQTQPSTPGGPPTTSTTASVTTSTVIAVGERVMTVPAPRGQGVAPAPPWPSYRAPVSLAAGTEKTLTLMVLEAPYGFGVELRDVRGEPMAAAPGPLPIVLCSAGPGCKPWHVLLLSEVGDAGVMLEALPQHVAPGLDVFQVRSAGDFPDLALHLAGVDAVVIDGFDTASLSARQLRALEQYVSLGGSLLLAGGAAWARTLEALPPALVPLRPDRSVEGSLGALADLVGVSTAATATLLSGQADPGQVVLAAPGGPALVVEADHGAGRIVQLAYDPLADPIASDQFLRGVAWDQGLARVMSGRAVVPDAFLPQPLPDQIWASTLRGRPWPSWPRWSVGILGAYALVFGPMAFALCRRRGPAATTAVMLAGSVLVVGTAMAAEAGRGHLANSVVEVRTLGPGGAAMTTTYRGRYALDASQPPRLASAAAASTVFSGEPVFRHPNGRLNYFDPAEGVARGVGGGTVLTGGKHPAVLTGGKHPAVSTAAGRWGLQTVQSVSVGDGGPHLEAALHLVGGSSSSPGRLKGSVTNRGPVALHHLRSHVAEGQAVVAESLAPGATVEVDAPVVAARRAPADGLPAGAPEEAVMFAVASSAFTAPGQAVVVGVTDKADSDKAGGAKGGDRKISVALTHVALGAGDTLPAGMAWARLVSSSPAPGAGSATVYDMKVPDGVGPLSVRYLARYQSIFFPAPRPTIVETYNWTTGEWRSLPVVEQPAHNYLDERLEEGEVRAGRVRLRHRDPSPTPVPIPAKLILTNDPGPGSTWNLGE